MRSVLFWSLAPFTLPQGIRLRRTAPRFAAAAGPAEGVVGEGPLLRLVAVGDSIIAGVGASTLDLALPGQAARALAARLGRRVAWLARGSIGARARKVRERLLEGLPLAQTDVVALSVGVNDVTAFARLGTWRRELGALLDELHRRAPEAVVAVAGIPPLRGFPLLPQPMRTLLGLRGVAFDQVAREVIGQRPWAVHVPLEFDPRPERFSADGFHPSEASYEEFGALVAQALQDRLPPPVGTSG